MPPAALASRQRDTGAVICSGQAARAGFGSAGDLWCASTQLRPSVGAVSDGQTAEAAVAYRRDTLEVLLAAVGPG